MSFAERVVAFTVGVVMRTRRGSRLADRRGCARVANSWRASTLFDVGPRITTMAE